MPPTCRQRTFCRARPSTCRAAAAAGTACVATGLSADRGTCCRHRLGKTPGNGGVQGKLKPWTPGQTAGSCR